MFYIVPDQIAIKGQGNYSGNCENVKYSTKFPVTMYVSGFFVAFIFQFCCEKTFS